MRTRCRGYDVASLSPCRQTATVAVIAGCRHEHVGERPLCDWHVADARRGIHLCGDCLEIDGHRCELRIARVRPLAAAS